MTTLAQGDLPKDNGILKTAARHNQARVGAYASVLQGGKFRKRRTIGYAWNPFDLRSTVEIMQAPWFRDVHCSPDCTTIDWEDF